MMWPFPDDGSFFSDQRRFPPTDNPDVRLTYCVAEALLTDARTRHQRIAIEVQNGVVLLSGTVDSRSAKQLTGDTVRGVAGVADICNTLRVTGNDTEPPGDEFQDVIAELGTLEVPVAGRPGKQHRPVVTWSILAAGTWVLLTLLMVTSRWTGVALTCLAVGLILAVMHWRRRHLPDAVSPKKR